MKRATDLPELLSPAGDMDALAAAILGGADAIYVGGKRFGARAFAKNFNEDELKAAVTLCHVNGVRLYVTLNTLIFDKEIDDAVEYARLLHSIGVDALIVADIGVAALIKREIPDLELHASTQMGAHNTEGVNFAASLGTSRVVLARECSGRDIKKIVAESNAECEVFLHGALCVCHSGQCLFSSMVGGRSGNRGECAQPCRLPYNKGKYILSLKDLSLADHVKELIESGVSSLKIEGRMKSPEYVYEVTRIYRSLLDENRNANSKENERLAAIFSRGGFTDGYFTERLFSAMTGVRSDDDKKASREVKQEKTGGSKIPLSAKASFKLGEKSELTLTAPTFSRWGRAVGEDVSATVYGDVPSPAETSPLDKSGLCARLSKMGNTPFSLDAAEVEIELDGGINLPPSSINALRREAVEKLLSYYGRPLELIIGADRYVGEPSGKMKNALADEFFSRERDTEINTALFFKIDTLRGALAKSSYALEPVDVIFAPLFDYEKLSAEERERVSGVYIPPIIMEREWDEVKRVVLNAEGLGARYALLENISHFALISGTKLVPVADFRLNTANKYTRAIERALGASLVVLSPELTLPQARDVGGSVITLGRIPLMITERCFTKESFGCDKCGSAALTDRLGMRFPMLREYKHRNIIFNSAPTYMGDKKNELRAARIRSTHFIFSSESVDECRDLLSRYRNAAPLNTPHRRVGKR